MAQWARLPLLMLHLHGCLFHSWLLQFQSSFLLVLPGKQQHKTVQVLGLILETQMKLPAAGFNLAWP